MKKKSLVFLAVAMLFLMSGYALAIPVCDYLEIEDGQRFIGPDQPIVFRMRSATEGPTDFIYSFFNEENRVAGIPQPIGELGNDNGFAITQQVSAQETTYTLTYDQLPDIDQNTGKKPQHFQVNGYVWDGTAEEGDRISAPADACIVHFNISRPNICEELIVVGDNTISQDHDVTVRLTASEDQHEDWEDRTTFSLSFYNRDNQYEEESPWGENPKGIYSQPGQSMIMRFPYTGDSRVFEHTLTLDDIVRYDYNYNRQRPERIQINGYVTLEGGVTSAIHPDCIVWIDVDWPEEDEISGEQNFFYCPEYNDNYDSYGFDYYDKETYFNLSRDEPDVVFDEWNPGCGEELSNAADMVAYVDDPTDCVLPTIEGEPAGINLIYNPEFDIAAGWSGVVHDHPLGWWRGNNNWEDHLSWIVRQEGDNALFVMSTDEHDVNIAQSVAVTDSGTYGLFVDYKNLVDEEWGAIAMVHRVLGAGQVEEIEESKIYLNNKEWGRENSLFQVSEPGNYQVSLFAFDGSQVYLDDVTFARIQDDPHTPETELGPNLIQNAGFEDTERISRPRIFGLGWSRGHQLGTGPFPTSWGDQFILLNNDNLWMRSAGFIEGFKLNNSQLIPISAEDTGTYTLRVDAKVTVEPEIGLLTTKAMLQCAEGCAACGYATGEYLQSSVISPTSSHWTTYTRTFDIDCAATYKLSLFANEGAQVRYDNIVLAKTTGYSSVPVDTITDADGDGKDEICISMDGIQGGWMDADASKHYCNYYSSAGGSAEWFGCDALTHDCEQGVDDFPEYEGVCCGDDPGDNVVETEVGETGSTGTQNCVFDPTTNEFVCSPPTFYFNPSSLGPYSACCDSSNSCVNEFGECMPADYSYCLAEASETRATCVEFDGEYVWDISEDTSCLSACDLCNFVNPNQNVYEIDIEDTTFLKLKLEENAQSDDYDTNQDGFFTQADVDFCGDFIPMTCPGPGGPNPPPPEQQCADNLCDGSKIREYVSGNPPACIYSSSAVCDAATCGAECDANNPCGDGYCNNNCECVESPVYDELSVHIDEQSCSYEICFNSDTNPGTTDVFTGSIYTDSSFDNVVMTEHEQGEGDLYQVINSRRISFVSYVTDSRDCISFSTDDEVAFDLELDGAAISDYNMIELYREGVLTEDHPSAMPFDFTTSRTDSCRICVATEEVETTVDDGIDNDCDGLVDEPPFTEEGVYIWETNCDYYVCVHDVQEVDGTMESDGFSGLEAIYWEAEDDYSLSPDTKTIGFTSYAGEEVDCLKFNAGSVIEFDIEEEVYIGHNYMQPLSNPFEYSNPECALSCNDPSMCGYDSIIGHLGCTPEQCVFDCGGYWIEGTSTLDRAFDLVLTYPGSYCEDCEADMECSDYNNEYSCHYNPCSTGNERFGCAWDEDTDTCIDAFESCVPGTTLCSDGVCRQEEECELLAGCIGEANGICELFEGCGCEDCEGEQDSCVDDAICSDNVCGCEEGTTLCQDGTCDDTCENNGGPQSCVGDPDGDCDFGEGCACEDCYDEQDSCAEDLVCDEESQVCVDEESDENDDDDTYETCEEGETLCADGTCDDTCENNGGKAGCIGIADGDCELGEGCACEDCYGKRDSCEAGLVCDPEDEVCDEKSSGGGPVDKLCVDLDGDGYDNIDPDCTGSDDCNDKNSKVNPGMLELCDGLDNDCDGEIDEDCATGETTFAVESADDISIFTDFDFVLEVENRKDEPAELSVKLHTPSGFGFHRGSTIIADLEPGESGSFDFQAYIKEYDSDEAEFVIEVTDGDDRYLEEVTVDITIPDFAVLPDPAQRGERCRDFYYVFNDNSLADRVDIEMNVVNPDAVLGKTLLVDYMAGLDADGVQIGELVSNPYCLDYKDNYEIHGYIYQTNGGAGLGTGPSYQKRINMEDDQEIVVKLTLWGEQE